MRFPVNKHVVFATTRRNAHSHPASWGALKHEGGMNVPLPIPLGSTPVWEIASGMGVCDVLY